MDRTLHEKLTGWHKQIEIVRKAEEKYFLLEASEKGLAAKLFAKSTGNNAKERESNALNCYDWNTFKKGLALAKSKYNHEKRILELKMKAYESEHATYKLEGQAIRFGKS